MKAVTYSSRGASDVLTVIDRDEPHPGAGEVRVRIHVSAVNPTDWKARRSGGALDQPQVPNQDGAGVIDEVGEGVEDLRPGDRVWVWDAAYRRPDGTAQELVVLPRRQVVVLPETASFDLGASLGIPALTAHHALAASAQGPSELAAGSLAGRTVLVAGGAGAVGHAAIQLAVWAGATVIATVSSPEKGALARAAGAHHVVDYTASDAAAQISALAPRGVDIVAEVNVAANAALDAEVVGVNAVVASYADAPGADDVSIPIRPSMAKNIRWQFLLTYTITDEQKDAAVRAVAAAVADGALPVGEEHGLPIARYALAETAQAHDAVEGGFVGKVLIDVV
ncbi:NADPH:quinone reductase [Microbacterium sp. 4R-513]|uniref:NADPH:quinone reductase n=1 Tax=Microbacterium sp. 4R-513 TaxID=2567934 RepID=UPI0013E13597|nr:NADPH:quinone reductase [Microbacterium sp. 4R-513]QIG38719.1 NADPH:quinone reductase [Microbacterium sp. 4R-513]